MHNALDPRDLVPDEAEQLVSAGYPAADLLERARQAAADDDLTALATVETELAALERPADWPYDEPPAAPVELPPAPVDEDTLADRISGAWLGRCIGNTIGAPRRSRGCPAELAAGRQPACRPRAAHRRRHR